MKKWKKPKYLREAHARTQVKLVCGATGRWSYLPCHGPTNYSDNTCTEEDFRAYCKRVGLKKADVDAILNGEGGVLFLPHEDELKDLQDDWFIPPIGVCLTPVNVSSYSWDPEWKSPGTVWIYS